MHIHVHVHVLMRDEKDGRKKQARSNKQQDKATQHTQGSHLSSNIVASHGTRVISLAQKLLTKIIKSEL